MDDLRSNIEDDPNQKKIEKINDYKERMANKSRRLAKINKRMIKTMKIKDDSMNFNKCMMERSGNISNKAECTIGETMGNGNMFET
jgi:hypothetical protein